MEWISVDDRMPQEGEKVLIYIPFRGVHLNYVSYVEGGKWFVPAMYGRNNITDVTHWLPLPEPPKED